jgi:hypothetical protein
VDRLPVGCLKAPKKRKTVSKFIVSRNPNISAKGDIMARTKRSKQIAQFVGRQSHLPGMLPSPPRRRVPRSTRPATPSLVRAATSTLSSRMAARSTTTATARSTRPDLPQVRRRSRREVGPTVAARVSGLPAVASALALGFPPPASETFNRRDVSTREPKVKGRKKLVSQFLAKNGKF